MKVLAVDTTSERESVALADDSVVLGEVRRRQAGRPSVHVLPALEFLLQSAGLRAADVEAYAVTLGPGSFTGVRVGISTVQGLALAGGRPCLGVSTLDVLARQIEGEAPLLVPMVDAARAAQVFAARYDEAGRPLGEPESVSPAAFARALAGPAAFVGDGAERYRAEIAAAKPDALFPPRDLFLAATLAGMAEARLRAGEGVTPAALRPLYLRAADVRPSSR